MTHALDRMLASRRRAWAAALVALVAALATAIAAAPTAAVALATADGVNPCATTPDTNFLGADASRAGVIDLYFFHGGSAPVTYFECVGGRAQRLGTAASPAPPTILADATTWSCVRLKRRFVATATAADGSTESGSFGVRTGSCARRFELRAPRRIAPGSKLVVRVVDRWAIGAIRPQLCFTPPHARRSCRTLAFESAVASARRSVRANARGEWRVELRVRGHSLRTTVAVGGERAKQAAPPPVVLATGDSMMQGIDSFLGDDLGDAYAVRSDVRPGTGISKGLPWLDWATQQARDLRPSVTVIAIGANDGLPMPAAGDCCGATWIAEYARRVRVMMRSYRRHGRGRVIWLTLPAPRPGNHDLPFAAVNRAIVDAAAGMSGVTVLRIDQIFTPSGYRDVMRYRGRDVRVREPDGIHLNISGTAIAATAVAKLIAAPAR
jgi:lysophospholipase L1-like esterase